MTRRWGALPTVVAFLSAAAGALTTPGVRATEAGPPASAQGARPLPRGDSYIQYGVALTVEGVASPGPICSDSANPCILGSGGGISARGGWRPTQHLYLGIAYEFSKQDPNKLYRLAILQQARAELRSYFPTKRAFSPFVLLSLGVAGYGESWSVDTSGPASTIGGGVEFELSEQLLLVMSLAYRPVYLRSFVDSSTISHDSGIAHLVGFELALESRDPL